MARILVIEDHPDNLELMRYLLLAAGHVVLEASTGGTGVAVAAAEQPELILCDIQLPDFDGEEVVRRLRADPASAQVPVVAVTSFAMVGDRERLLASGFDGYMSKPLDPQTFVSSVETFITGKASPTRARETPARTATPEAAPTAPTPPTAVRKRAGAGTRSKSGRPGPRGPRIVIVDDNRPNREFLHDLLTGAGYEVELCASADAALGAIASATPDLVISDVHMRPVDGFALFRTVRATAPASEAPFMFVSNSVWGSAEVQRGMAMGAAGFILRPVAPEVILEEVARVLRGD